uniref:Uncharacterized protein n=1 Tax=Romanomermis culicivorax TaxID=13658 RepID=A0A915K2K2_ROMCU
MLLMYYLDDKQTRVYTLKAKTAALEPIQYKKDERLDKKIASTNKVDPNGKPTISAHPVCRAGFKRLYHYLSDLAENFLFVDKKRDATCNSLAKAKAAFTLHGHNHGGRNQSDYAIKN